MQYFLGFPLYLTITITQIPESSPLMRMLESIVFVSRVNAGSVQLDSVNVYTTFSFTIQSFKIVQLFDPCARGVGQFCNNGWRKAR